MISSSVPVELTTPRASFVANARSSDERSERSMRVPMTSCANASRSRTARSAAGSFNRDHGLGLVLVDRIARAHEGSLSLDGAPGEGFSVTLALPLA